MSDRKVRIFVVEDEAIVAMDLRNSLEILGYQVVGTASTGEVAIAKALETRPDLMLMDIMLKGEMDGIQAADAIRSRLDIPVIFLTAYSDEATLQRAKVTEPFGYLLKPFEERELLSHIEIALYKHRTEKKLRESEERYSLATQGANDGLWDWRLESNEIYFSPRWISMLGFSDGQFGHSPEDWFKRIHPSDKEQVEQGLNAHLLGRTSHFESEYRILGANNAYRWVLCRGLALRNGNGKAYRIAGSQTDITDRKVYNPLTGLPNRILLIDRLERALKRVNSNNDPAFAVLALDVDGLKMINDSLGYVTGDNLLIQIAQRIQKYLSPQDTLAHFEKDEFVLLLEKIDNPDDATCLASGIHQELALPFHIDGQTIYVTASIGITFPNKAYNCPDELLRDAATAMHRARASGTGRCEIFDSEMRSSAVAKMKMDADFRRAVEEHEFRVHYQPIVCLRTGKLVGFEALLRWDRCGQIVYPVDFLALAEYTGLIIPIERWVLLESCLQMSRWQSMSGQPLKVNVNLCAKQYSSPDLVEDLETILKKSGLDPMCLRLEITESALMENTNAISETLTKIQALNVHVHMDDFGTGYSSLSYLHRFRVNALKIDRSFVGKLGMSEETWQIVQAIVSLAHNLGMEVIAEGIENLMQLRMLQTLHCQAAQGYYFSKALTPEGIETLLSVQYPWAVAFGGNTPKGFPFSVGASSLA